MALERAVWGQETVKLAKGTTGIALALPFLGAIQRDLGPYAVHSTNCVTKSSYSPTSTPLHAQNRVTARFTGIPISLSQRDIVRGIC